MALEEPRVSMDGEEGFSLGSIPVANPNALQQLL
jgi:hypothetical protein